MIEDIQELTRQFDTIERELRILRYLVSKKIRTQNGYRINSNKQQIPAPCRIKKER